MLIYRYHEQYMVPFSGILNIIKKEWRSRNTLVETHSLATIVSGNKRDS